MLTKLCPKCKIDKPHSEYHMRTDKGYTYPKSYCKQCSRISNNRYDKCQCGSPKDTRSEHCAKCSSKNRIKKQHICPCGESDLSKFYAKSKGRMQHHCKKCHNSYTIKRWVDIKIKAISYKDGKCNRCGFSSHHYSVYEFHHIKGQEKTHDWNKLRKCKWETIKSELDKCEMLCANCHRIEHEGNYNHSYHEA